MAADWGEAYPKSAASLDFSQSASGATCLMDGTTLWLKSED